MFLVSDNSKKHNYIKSLMIGCKIFLLSFRFGMILIPKIDVLLETLLVSLLILIQFIDLLVEVFLTPDCLIIY